jgi:Fe-S cluster assembly iron-binding protein IscA
MIPMLQCTPAAAATLDQVREQQGLPETYGLRIFPAQSPEGQMTLGLGFAEAPEDGDQVGEQHGTRLFVAPELAEELSDMALDIEPDPTQDGGSAPQLVLRRSPGD